MFTPSIVPAADDTVYLVEDDYGSLGRSFRETDTAHADRETTLRDLLSGQYQDPVRVIAFNTREGWSKDVSHEIAVELQRRADLERRELSGNLTVFIEQNTHRARQLSLRLV